MFNINITVRRLKMDLLIPLNKEAKVPLYEQLYEGIKQAILTQQITKNTKLPSKRQLAEFLNISQTTVELAYSQLLAEGYIMSEPRIGFFVEDILELPYIERQNHIDALPILPKKQIAFNFSPSIVDEESFPFSTWRKYAKLVIDEPYKHLLQTGHQQGEEDLRKEIAHYLFQSRGIQCTPEQIVIGSGTEHLLPMILNLFEAPSKLAVEDPGYSALPIDQSNEAIIPIEIDEDGLIVEQLEKTNANIVYVTPSHQFPTGAVLSAVRRMHLLNWANGAHNRYVIEDDYDSEFRYVGKPIAALQSIDHNDKVIYLSTFTKSLMPSLRVAYFVLPKTLLATYRERLSYYTSTVPRFEQHILALFMKNGDFSKHLNKMRKIYRKKHDKIIQTFRQHYPQVEITGAEAGMHFLIHLNTKSSEKQLLAQAEEAGILIRAVSSYMHSPSQVNTTSFLVGFGGLELEKIEDAVHALMAAFIQ